MVAFGYIVFYIRALFEENTNASSGQCRGSLAWFAGRPRRAGACVGVSRRTRRAPEGKRRPERKAKSAEGSFRGRLAMRQLWRLPRLLRPHDLLQVRGGEKQRQRKGQGQSGPSGRVPDSSGAWVKHGSGHVHGGRQGGRAREYEFIYVSAHGVRRPCRGQRRGKGLFAELTFYPIPSLYFKALGGDSGQGHSGQGHPSQQGLPEPSGGGRARHLCSGSQEGLHQHRHFAFHSSPGLTYTDTCIRLIVDFAVYGRYRAAQLDEPHDDRQRASSLGRYLRR